MTKELSLQCPYKVEVDTNTQTYRFITKNNIRYEVAFTECSNCYSDTSVGDDIKNIYTITVEKLSDEKDSYDSNVRKTVDSILSEFFKDKEKALLYICDDSDHRELSRFKTFHRWYEYSELKDKLKKIDNKIPIPDSDRFQYTSLTYHIDNPFKDSIDQAHQEVVYYLTNDK